MPTSSHFILPLCASSHGLQLLQSIPTCSSMGFFTDWRLGTCSGVGSAVGESLLLPSALTSAPTSCYPRFFPYFPLSGNVFAFLTHALPEAPPSWLLSSAVPCSGSIGTSCVWHRLAPASPHRDHPCNPTPLPTLINVVIFFLCIMCSC